jgi:host factor-I protein
VHGNKNCKLIRFNGVPPMAVEISASTLRCNSKCHGVRRASEKTLEIKKRKTTMAAEKTQNLQDTFLNYVRKNKTPLTIFLINGVKLQGIVSWFDNFCVLLRRDGHSQLVYKHAISTIMPGGPVNLNEQDGEGTPS